MLIGGYQPFSLSDYPGRTAAIVFTQGCNLRCPYCHNRQLWPEQPTQSETVGEESVLRELMKRAGLLDGVVVTGGEPTIQPDIISFFEQIKQLGLAIKLDTNGTLPHVVQSLVQAGLVDYIAMDIKAPADKYQTLAGCPVEWGQIQSSINIIRSSSVRHHFRTTYDRSRLSDEDIGKIRRLIPEEEFVVQNCLKPEVKGTTK